MSEQQERALRVLSIQAASMGHGTYGRLMRQVFDSSSCQLNAFWLDEERELHTRVLRRLLSYELPGRWAREQNIDLRRARIEWALGHTARRLAGRKMEQASRDGKPYHALHFHTQVLGFGSLDLMRRIPTVLTGDMTAVQISRETTDARFRWTHALNRRMERRAFRAARHISFWSKWAARSAVQECGVPEEKVQVIYPGVDADALRPPAQRPLQNSSPSNGSNPVRLLFVGWDWERKGGPDVLDVFLREFTHKAELHLMTGAQLSCSHPRVHMHRDVRAYSKEWHALYHDADVFVMPTHREAFGLALTEAMAVGLPVVSTRLNAIPEIVEHGATGFLITPGDPRALAARLRDLIANPMLRRQMGASGREVVEQKFDANINFARLEELLRSVAAHLLA